MSILSLYFADKTNIIILRIDSHLLKPFQPPILGSFFIKKDAKIKGKAIYAPLE